MNPSGFEYNLDVSEMLLIFVNRGAIITYADNVLLFLPLTVLAYCSEYEFFRDIKWATIFSLLCSLSIELLQGVEAYARVLEDTMPGLETLRMYKELGGRIITVGSDSHRPERIGYGFDRVYQMLKEAGFDSISVYKNRKNIQQPI